MAIEIVTGDPVRRLVQLKKTTDSGDVAFVINGTATVRAAVVDADKLNKLTDDATLISGATGADWSTSLVAVVIPETETEKITVDKPTVDAYIEIEVDDSYPLTWFVPATIEKGNIT